MMKIPFNGNIDEVIKVFKVRAEGKSWEIVAEETHHSKPTVMDVHNWFQSLPKEKLSAFSEDIIRLRHDYMEIKAEQHEKEKEWLQHGLIRKEAVQRHWDDLNKMAKKVIQYISTPDPIHFLVFDLSHGRYYNEAACCGLYWICEPDKPDMDIHYMNDPDSYATLEDETFFEPLMIHLPQIKEQYEKLRVLTGEYIKKCFQMFVAIKDEAKDDILKLYGNKMSDESRQVFLGADAHDYVVKLQIDDESYLLIYLDFFTSIYDDALIRARYDANIDHQNYVVDSEGTLRWGVQIIAAGTNLGIQEVRNLHQELIAKYCKSSAPQLLSTFTEISGLANSMGQELELRIHKRTFPGSCELCPD